MYSLVPVLCFYSVFLHFNYIIFVLIVLILFARIVRLRNNDTLIILMFILKSPISFYINKCKKKIVHFYENNIRISINKLMY